MAIERIVDTVRMMTTLKSSELKLIASAEVSLVCWSGRLKRNLRLAIDAVKARRAVGSRIIMVPPNLVKQL